MEEINRKKEEELKQNAKKRNRRRPVAADNNKIQETSDGVKIEVPNGREGTFNCNRILLLQQAERHLLHSLNNSGTKN